VINGFLNIVLGGWMINGLMAMEHGRGERVLWVQHTRNGRRGKQLDDSAGPLIGKTDQYARPTMRRRVGLACTNSLTEGGGSDMK
jgi:hypothetical protein